MKKMAALFVLCSILVFTISCATHEANIQQSGARLLTQADLEAIFSKNVTLFYQTSQSSGSTTYKSDGTCAVISGTFSDTGTYWIENGQYCSKWKKGRGGSVTCQRWYQIADNEYHQIDSAGNLLAKMRR
jgi:hypothetical protein